MSEILDLCYYLKGHKFSIEKNFSYLLYCKKKGSTYRIKRRYLSFFFFIKAILWTTSYKKKWKKKSRRYYDEQILHLNVWYYNCLLMLHGMNNRVDSYLSFCYWIILYSIYYSILRSMIIYHRSCELKSSTKS